MNNIDKQYTDLLQDILDNGATKQTRNGGTLSVFGRQIRHKMSDGFPLLTTKKMAWKTMVTELLWFLRGDTNIKFLVDNNCHIWDGDAYKNWCRQFEVDSNNFNGEELAKGHNDQCWGYPLLENTSKEYKRGQINAYLEGKAEKPFFYLTQEEFINKIKTDDEFAKKWGELGPIYGKQWRRWREDEYTTPLGLDGPSIWKEGIDQIANLINDLKTNPDSRRLMVNAWNVGELDQMILPPCHYGFQVYTRELSLEERLCIADKFNPLIREDCLTKTHHPDETEERKLQIRHEWLDSLGPNVVPQRRAISLMWNQRSVDTFLGLPFNIASYGLLLEIIAKEVNMVPDELIGNLGDVHLYSNHIEQAKEQIGRELSESERYRIFEDRGYEFRMVKDWSKEEQYDKAGIPKRTREPFNLPTLDIHPGMLDYDMEKYEIGLFNIKNYQSHPSIKAPLSN